ncbi:hypothetical protein P7K49_030635 [Saguinus oedipus]|uniref:Uncharacterized protein n=1 Tax=Saguinus oedipus TaxID=9490 RepID=A0ABQ9U2Q0_SAGOE|nr:hypothetical protein P7K49_030635 [Saguinus oedipus]
MPAGRHFRGLVAAAVPGLGQPRRWWTNCGGPWSRGPGTQSEPQEHLPLRDCSGRWEEHIQGGCASRGALGKGCVSPAVRLLAQGALDLGGVPNQRLPLLHLREMAPCPQVHQEALENPAAACPTAGPPRGSRRACTRDFGSRPALELMREAGEMVLVPSEASPGAPAFISPSARSLPGTLALGPLPTSRLRCLSRRNDTPSISHSWVDGSLPARRRRSPQLSAGLHAPLAPPLPLIMRSCSDIGLEELYHFPTVLAEDLVGAGPGRAFDAGRTEEVGADLRALAPRLPENRQQRQPPRETVAAAASR